VKLTVRVRVGGLASGIFNVNAPVYVPGAKVLVSAEVCKTVGRVPLVGVVTKPCPVTLAVNAEPLVLVTIGVSAANIPGVAVGMR